MWANEILDREAEREASLGEAKKCGCETRKAKKVDAVSARTPLTQRGETHRFLTAKLDVKPLAGGKKVKQKVAGKDKLCCPDQAKKKAKKHHQRGEKNAFLNAKLDAKPLLGAPRQSSFCAIHRVRKHIHFGASGDKTLIKKSCKASCKMPCKITVQDPDPRKKTGPKRGCVKCLCEA